MPTRSASVTAILLLALVAGPARAEEPAGDPLAAFRAFVGDGLDPDMPWDARWRAYQEAKPGLDAERAPIISARRAHERLERLGPDQLTDARREEAAAYDSTLWNEFVRYQTALANWIRRDQMPLGGWIMGIFAALLLWGGFTVCVRIANKSDKSLREPPPDEVTWPHRPES